MSEKDPHRYDDMLTMPHHISSRHAPMPMLSRAAQFSSFAALSGYEAKISAAQYQRCNRIQLSEDEQKAVNDVLYSLRKYDSVTAVCFHDDPGTDGSGGYADGVYLTISGTVTLLDPVCRTMRISREEEWTDLNFEDILTIQRSCKE